MSDRYKGAILSPTAPTVTPQSAGGIYTSSQQLQYQGQGVWPSAVNYPINNSLRFRASASAYLNRTPASAGNQKTWTWSGWVKRGTLGTYNFGLIFCDTGSNSNKNEFGFFNTDSLFFEYSTGGITQGDLKTTQVFRDPSAWYHIVLAVDTTQATSSNRIKMYVNGSQVTSFSSATYPSQNTDMYINSTNVHDIGRGNRNSGAIYLDAYLSEINFIDGVQLTPSSFGTTDAYGIWQPIPYTGAYGTNGFYLPFTDNSALTTSSNVGLGKDFSGNGNYWVTNNISITAGSTYDSMKDVPTNTNSNTANYCTLNPLDTNSNLALSNGNLTAIPSSTADYWLSRATMQLPSTGKWYWELTLNNTPYLYQAGIYSANRPNSGGTSGTGNEYQVAWGTAWTYIMYQSNNAAFAAWGTNTNPTSGDVLMFAVDSNSGSMWIGRNGTWYNTSGTANPATNTDPRFSSIPSGLFAGVNLPNPASGGVSMNFGQRPFSYTPPSGFYPLNTYNLPTPTILDGDQYMDATLYTGNGSTQSITNAGGFQPDLVWIKDRSNARVHNIQDSVRGVRKWLESNSTNAEGDSGSIITAFNSNGFSLNDALQVNANTETYVGWQWRASNAAGVSNTQGTITSTVSANTTAGFSIVTYTGNGTAGATVGHGLGVAPNFIFIKCRSNSPTNWFVGGSNIASAGNGTWSSVMEGLNTTNAINTGATSVFNSTAPTSSLVTLGTEANANGSGRTFVMYCWAEVAGYSKFGSYTGNGSSNGTFIYTGFRPRYVMIKTSSNAGYNWNVHDTARNPYNSANLVLYPNTSAGDDAYSAGSGLDILSNGFKIRDAGGGLNGSGFTYIYMAFAENPFKIARGR